MVIILEGVNGAGKSTVARLLSENLRIPIIRPFKNGDSEKHWNKTELEEWNNLKVPVNTHVEDLYVADLLRSFNMSAILDRSIVSAVAYGRVLNLDDGWYRLNGNTHKLMNKWEGMISQCKAPILYVWMDVSYIVAKDRCKNRAVFPNSVLFSSLAREFEKIFYRIKYQKIRLFSDISIPERYADVISEKVDEYV